MAVLVVNEMQGADQSVYDAVMPRVMPDGKLPDGCQLHIAGPSDGGWRVVTVWDSEQEFQQFRDQKLIPAIQEAGVADRATPKINVHPVHRLITK